MSIVNLRTIEALDRFVENAERAFPMSIAELELAVGRAYHAHRQAIRDYHSTVDVSAARVAIKDTRAVYDRAVSSLRLALLKGGDE